MCGLTIGLCRRTANLCALRGGGTIGQNRDKRLLPLRALNSSGHTGNKRLQPGRPVSAEAEVLRRGAER